MIDQPVMQAAGAALPKLDCCGAKNVAAPEGWHGNWLGIEVLLILTAGSFERFAIRDGRRLCAGPGTDLTAARTGREVGGAFVRGHAFDLPGGADLALQLFPVEAEGGMGVCIEFVAFAAVIVGEKREAARVERLEKHDADAGNCIGGRGGEAHGVCFYYRSGESFVEPSVELRYWVWKGKFFQQTRFGVVLAQFSEFCCVQLNSPSAWMPAEAAGSL